MKAFLRILILLVIFVSVFSFYITRDGELYTPQGEGEVKLNSGTYEAFPLPDYASEMIDQSYKTYFIEVEPGLKVRPRDRRRFSYFFNAWKSYIRIFV